jgi:aminodeoxyfutalosine deaminase
MTDLRKAGNRVEVHRAGWVVVDSRTILRDGYLLAVNGVIREARQGRIRESGAIIDHGPGALMPAFVNAHTHLELSGLQGSVPAEGGFRSWVRELIRVREETGPAALAEGAKAGIASLKRAGCGIVGEISSLGLTRELLAEAGFAGVWFREYLGSAFPADVPGGHPEQGGNTDGSPAGDPLIESLAGHGPHTTAPEVLVELKRRTRRDGLVFGLHLAESDDESEFLTTGKGPWADFLCERGIDFRAWRLPADSPVDYAEGLGLLDGRTLAVHLIQSGKKDFETLRRRGTKICLCPRSNAVLHGRLPDLDGMLKAGLNPCLGTDSLAAVDSLSPLDEMAFTAHAYPDIHPGTILMMATLNGAEALGFADRFGSLNPGKSALFAYAAITATSSQSLLEQWVHGTFLRNHGKYGK